MILLRNQSLDEDAQVRFAGTFGTPGENHLGPGVQRKASVRHADLEHPPNNDRRAVPDGEIVHTDQCHQENPGQGYDALRHQDPSQGGDTLFSNAYLAYETLPEDIKRRIAGRRALNAYTADTTLRSANYDDAKSSYWHPVVRTHPATDARRSMSTA